ncbi:MAG: response regulator [Lachnospiraceae bacterium]|nr:response regulator [Lachnospiraceae bacterium]
MERTTVFDGQTTLKFEIKDTGIGMAITKNIVDLMNGTISVESKKGEGTQFTIVITLKNCEHTDYDSSFLNYKDLRILVVDDEEVAAEHARLVLDEAGIKSDIAFSGVEALNMLEVAHTKQEHYNLVLLDWKMPEMDGLEATAAIRALDREDAAIVPIVAMTANAFDEDVQRSLQVGMNAHLSKPVEPERLYRSLEELIGEADTRKSF